MTIKSKLTLNALAMLAVIIAVVHRQPDRHGHSEREAHGSH